MRCAELERFFSKVLRFLGVAVLADRKGLGLCPVPTAAHNATNPDREWSWVAARTDGAQSNDYSGLQPKALCARVAAGAAGDAASLQRPEQGWALAEGWVEDVLREGDMAGTTFFYEQANPGNILWEPPPGSTKKNAPEGGGAAEDSALTGWQPPAGLEVHGVDLLIGADGSKSAVRSAAGVEFEPQDTLMLPDHQSNNVAGGQRRSLRLDGLEQTTLIAKFAQIEGKNGRLKCPPTRVIDDRADRVVGMGMIDPFYPALVIQGVTSVFKRFFEDECEIQVLLNEEFAALLWGRVDGGAAVAAEETAWAKLQEVTAFLIPPSLWLISPHVLAHVCSRVACLVGAGGEFADRFAGEWWGGECAGVSDHWWVEGGADTGGGRGAGAHC